MTARLVTLIDTFVKYAESSGHAVPVNILKLESDLVQLYSIYFEVPQDHYQKEDYSEPEMILTDLRQNLSANFPDLGYYKVLQHIIRFEDANEIMMGDAVDDLHDIIKELLEVRWRIENNSEADGLWHFKFNFEAHIKGHLLGLLTYINELKYIV